MGVQEIKNTFGAGHGTLQDVEFFTEIADRFEKFLRILDEGDQGSQRERLLKYPVSPVPDDESDSQRTDQVDYRVKDRIVEKWIVDWPAGVQNFSLQTP